MPRHAEGKQMLLVVDEAQNLPPRSVEELRMLSNFQVNNKALVQTFLLGQEEFKRDPAEPGNGAGAATHHRLLPPGSVKH